MAQTPPQPIVMPRRVIGRARSITPYDGYQSGDSIRRDDVVNMNQAARNRRALQAAATTLRNHFETNDIFSTAVTNFVAMMGTNYKLMAYEVASQEFSREGMMAAEHVLSLLSSERDYAKGFSDKRGVDGLLETMRIEVLLAAGVGLELVLDNYRLPSDLVVFPYDSFTWKSKGPHKGKFPVQRDAQGNEVELNMPTIFISESMKTAERKYALPILHAGISRVMHYEQFLDDAWRVITRSGMSRLVLTLNYDKVVASAPREIQQDPAKLNSYLESVRAGHETALQGLAPEDTLVMYDTAEAEALKAQGEKAEISELIEQLSGLAASALKSNPSMLGLRIGGSQNTSTTEAMLSTLTAKLLNRPVADALSRALTLACRLYGLDVRVKFKFDEIELRPETEMEPHKAVRQNRILELLSLGRVTDDEAQVELGLGSLPESSESLSGTRFYESKSPDTTPVSGTNSRNRQISPETPSSAGGKDNEQR